MNRRMNQKGQAIVEMTVGLIGMAAIFCGFILIARLAKANIENLLTARGNIHETANADVENIADAGVPILYWNPPYGYRNRPADIPVGPTFEDTNKFKDQLVDNTGVFSIDSFPSIIDNASSFNLDALYMFLNAANLKSGTGFKTILVDEDIPLDSSQTSLTSKLLLDKSETKTITLEDTLYMPSTN